MKTEDLHSEYVPDAGSCPGLDRFRRWKRMSGCDESPRNMTMKRPPSTLLFALFVLPLLLGGVSPAVAADPGLEPHSYIRSVNPGAVRNDFDGFLGMAFTVGEERLTVTRLGRMMLEGNSGTHQVKLVRHSDGLDVVGGSVEVSMAGGTPGQSAIR